MNLCVLIKLTRFFLLILENFLNLWYNIYSKEKDLKNLKEKRKYIWVRFMISIQQENLILR